MQQFRLLVIAYTTIYLRNIMVVQVLILSVISIFLIALLGFIRPVRKSFAQLMDEFVVIIVLDLLFFSTDPILDPDYRIYLGWVLIGLLGLSIVVNQGTLLVKSLITMKKACKKKWHTYWRKKASREGSKAKESQVDKEKELD